MRQAEISGTAPPSKDDRKSKEIFHIGSAEIVSADFYRIFLDKYPWGVYNEDRKGGIHMSEKCCCSHKTKERSEEEYKKLIHRLNRIEGQIRGIRGMVEENAYCTDILIQVSAVNAALNAFNRELLANHIRTCVTNDIRSGKDETVDELVSTLQKLMK